MSEARFNDRLDEALDHAESIAQFHEHAYAHEAATIQGEYERVDHPPHYNQHPAGIECIDVIEHLPANIALAIKHQWRLGLTPYTEALVDLDKAIWYLQREKERIVKFGLFR